MTHDELAAFMFGLSWDQEADRMELFFDIAYPQSGNYLAAKRARANAMVLDDVRAHGRATPDQRAGLRLQAQWWRAVANELEERTLVT